MKVRYASLIVVAHAAADINQGAIPVLLPYLITQHHISITAATGVIFVLNFVSTALQPLFGYISDRRSRPWIIPVAMLVLGIGISFAGVTPSYGLGLVGLAVAGVGVAAFHPEGARLMNYLAGDQKATGMSLFGIGGQAGFALGPLMATYLLIAMGLKGITVLLLPTAVMATVMVFKLPALTLGYETKGLAKGTRSREGGEDRWRPFGCAALTLILRSVLVYTLMAFIPLYWISVLHQSKAAGGTALSILLGSTIVGNFFGSRAAERFGYRRVTIAGQALLMVLMPWLVITTNPVAAMLVLIPIGLVLSASFGATVALGQSYLPNRVGFAAGVTMGLALTFGGLTTPIFGWIADSYSIRTALAIAACLPVINTGLAFTLPDLVKVRSDNSHAD